MAVMMGDLYEALKLAGADGDSARKAAEEVASYDNRIADSKTKMVGIKGELGLLKSMIGFNVAMTIALVGKVFLSH